MTINGTEVIDKSNVIENLGLRNSVELELGCGPNKKKCTSIGIDAIDFDGVDLLGDIFEILKLFPNSSVDAVYAYHFIEHIENIESLLTELLRVIKPGGAIEFVAPHYSNPYFYSDPTHKRFFGLYTFCYLAESKIFKRTVPNYSKVKDLELIDVKLNFKSSKYFPIRYALKYLVGMVVNATNYSKEFYEENLCYLVPCYEVVYRLKSNKPYD